MKLERVEIGRLRGIPGDWPALTIGEKGLIVYGPNGVGKSSIIDALEATIARRSSLFKDNRAGGVNWGDASPHIKGGGPPTCVVHGMFRGKSQSVTLGSEPEADVADWMKAASAASFVLRRYMMLEFVDAEPKERYEQIEPFLNLAAFGEIEHGLKEIVHDLDIRLADFTSQSAGKAQIIRQTFRLQKNTPFSRAILAEILKERLSKAGLAVDITDFPTLAAKLAGELGDQASSAKLASLGAAKQNAQQLTSVSLLLPLYNQVLTAADHLATELKSASQKVPVDLLVKAHDYVNATSADLCPVCEQNIEIGELLPRLKERIEEDKALQLAASTLDQRLTVLGKAAAKASAAYAAFKGSWDQLGLGTLPSCYAEVGKLFVLLEALNAKTAGQDRDAMMAAFAVSECSPTDQIAKIDEAIVATGGGERRNLLMEADSYVSALQKDLAAYETLEGNLAIISKQKSLAEKLHAHAETSRKEAVQKIADRVAEVANAFYEKVHPGEQIATSRLTIRQSTTGSMLLSSIFHGQDAPPLKYYSESHLDTLGLCFFLAIRKLELISSPLFKLLLIDDVLHSVDADHRTRLAQLLKDHFSDHQIVLVTHDKNFYDRLRATLGSGYKYIAISGWDIDSGPRLSDPSTDLDRVVDPASRAGKSHEELAAAGGRFFEWLLKELTESLQVAIPARFTHAHDIGSMWPALAAKLRKHKGFVAAHPDLVNQLNDNVWVRNKIGAHDNNQSESPVTPAEVIEFIDGVAALYKATTCQHGSCGSTIQPVKSNKDVWRCDCSKLQYDSK